MPLEQPTIDQPEAAPEREPRETRALSLMFDKAVCELFEEQRAIAVTGQLSMHADEEIALEDLSFSAGATPCEHEIAADYPISEKRCEHSCILSLVFWERDFGRWSRGQSIKAHVACDSGTVSAHRIALSRECANTQYERYVNSDKRIVAYVRADDDENLALAVNGPQNFDAQAAAQRNREPLRREHISSIDTSRAWNEQNHMRARLHHPLFYNTRSNGEAVMRATGTLVATCDFLVCLQEFTLLVGGRACKARFSGCDTSAPGIEHTCRLDIEVTQDDILNMGYQNSVELRYTDTFGVESSCPVGFVSPFRKPLSKIARLHRGPKLKLEGNSVSARFKRGKGRLLTLGIQRTNSLDVGATIDDPYAHIIGNSVFAKFALPRFQNDSSSIGLSSRMVVRSDFPLSLSDIGFFIGDERIEAAVSADYPSNEKRFEHRFDVRLHMPYERAAEMPIHNTLKIGYTDPYGAYCYTGIRYIGVLKKYLALHGPYFVDPEHGLSAFFRQNVGANTTFTVRHTNPTDAPLAQAKLNAAWACAKLAWWIDPVLIYEKNCQHYEESGCAVFEKLIDQGYDIAWFVLSPSVAAQAPIDDKYRGKLLMQHSFKHYLYFFRCKRFIGTEAMAHCIDLRCQNLMVQRKLKDPDNYFVFLQHGVMYMVSLDSPERSSFKRRSMPEKCKVVVSSQLEAKHFIDYAGFHQDELIVCGLPKFDRSYQNPGADKILVMPTWRPWEFAAMRVDPENTKYVQMIERIVEAIPDELKDKVIVAPHPLFDANIFLGGNKSADDLPSYDVLLRDVSLLITDYSSIAYDAFYRGANVIFYWEEKDECMAQYGEPTHLMIDEETAFGPVCYTKTDLNRGISRSYLKDQSQQFATAYKRIVSNRDGHNSDRLVGNIEDVLYNGKPQTAKARI